MTKTTAINEKTSDDTNASSKNQITTPNNPLPSSEAVPTSSYPAELADVEKFEKMLSSYRDGTLDEDSFKIFRLNNGIYGQRQDNEHMVRVKLPYGGVRPEQLEMLGQVAQKYSRGWGHITTRQNIQFHFVKLDTVPSLLRDIASVGLTTREACGDTVRNITGCHLAGACPLEVLDITPWAEAAFRHFLRNPYSQRLPRKFKISFSGCVQDCAQGAFNDIGVVAITRTTQEGKLEKGFRLFIAGGLSATPHAAQVLEEFTPRELLLPTMEAVLRTFDHYGNRDNKIRARMKWLLDTMGIEELRERILKERKFLIASVTWKGGIPELVEKWGDEPNAQVNLGPEKPVPPAANLPGELTSANPVPDAYSQPIAFRDDKNSPSDPYQKWLSYNVIMAPSGKVSAYAHIRLGDITSEQFAELADIQRELQAEVRTTIRQNLVFKNLTVEQLPTLFKRLDAIKMSTPCAWLARDVVSCPGADSCNLAVTQSRGLATDISRALEEAGLAEIGEVRINISGCSDSCGQHHTADIGFMGAERRAHGQSAPGYQMFLGGYVDENGATFGAKALRLPAKNASEAAVRVIARFADERNLGESFHEWLQRQGGAKAVAANLADLDNFPTPEENPGFYIDFDETGPYVADVGIGECAGV